MGAVVTGVPIGLSAKQWTIAILVKLLTIPLSRLTRHSKRALPPSSFRCPMKEPLKSCNSRRPSDLVSLNGRATVGCANQSTTTWQLAQGAAIANETGVLRTQPRLKNRPLEELITEFLGTCIRIARLESGSFEGQPYPKMDNAWLMAQEGTGTHLDVLSRVLR